MDIFYDWMGMDEVIFWVSRVDREFFEYAS